MSGARCLIPAAGLGTRMRPASRTIPKELLPIGTRPMIQWCVTEALEAGFERVGVVVRDDKPLLAAYLREGRWREGILEEVRERAEALEIDRFVQERPLGVVDAVLSAGAWVDDGGAFAVFLPDNVRISGSPPLTAEQMADAAEREVALAACHRVGTESARYFGNVGRVELADLVPAGRLPRVTALQQRGRGAFRAPPEGAWRLMPRYVVTGRWVEIARRVAAEASLAGEEADDVAVHRRLVEEERLVAAPWEGTLVDAGNPSGYLYAHHLLHQAEARRRDAEERDGEGGGGELLEIGLS
ncbi:MAG: sugar phosphate nucleotidyltransferase [Gemmatimonadota bacterium]|nr:sugar phosphate nucleotidyltransferase [Gemmatimonadota bacterium]